MSRNPSHNAAVTTETTAAAQLVSKSSTRDLLRLYGAILSELVRRQVIRSRNAPAGEYAEYLAMVVYDGVLAPLSTKSSDLRAQDGRLVQVKSRVVVSGQSGNFSFFRSWAFDVCAFVKFDSETYDVISAIEVPIEAVRALSTVSAHVNGSRIRLRENLFKLEGAIDRTADFRRAQNAMT